MKYIIIQESEQPFYIIFPYMWTESEKLRIKLQTVSLLYSTEIEYTGLRIIGRTRRF